jgi:hypothetical protein
VLKLTAGAGVGVLGLGLWRAWDQGVFSSGEGPAYSAWQTWETATPSPAHQMVRAAILASNPHNSQPWRFRIGADTIDVFADRRRNIGSIDPYLREMHIGLGCALENLMLAAPAAGVSCEAVLLPDAADPTHVARVHLRSQQTTPSVLYRAIPMRHTNRGPYHDRLVAPALLRELQMQGSDLPRVTVRWVNDAAGLRRLSELIVQATQAIIEDREQSRDSAAWFRADWHAIQRHRDGLTIDAQALPDWLRAAAKVLPPVSQERADRVWLDNTRDIQVATAAAYGLIVARNSEDNADRMQGGRLWQRIQLHGVTRGLAMQPLNQLPERADRERSLGIGSLFGATLNDVLDDSAWQVLMPFRVGYPVMAARRSPRRHIEEVMLQAAAVKAIA